MPSATEALIAKRAELRTRVASVCAWHPAYDEPENPGWLGTLSQKDIESEVTVCRARPPYRQYLALGAELYRLRIRPLPES